MISPAHRVDCPACNAPAGMPCTIRVPGYVHVARDFAWQRSDQAKREFADELAAIGAVVITHWKGSNHGITSYPR